MRKFLAILLFPFMLQAQERLIPSVRVDTLRSATPSGRVVIDDSAKVTQILSVARDLDVTGIVYGDSVMNLTGPVTVVDTLNVSKILIVTSNGTIGGILYIDTLENLSGQVIVNDSLSVAKVLSVAGNALISGILYLDSLENLIGPVVVADTLNITKNISVTGDATLSSQVTIPTGAVSGYYLRTDGSGNAYWSPVATGVSTGSSGGWTVGMTGVASSFDGDFSSDPDGWTLQDGANLDATIALGKLKFTPLDTDAGTATAIKGYTDATISDRTITVSFSHYTNDGDGAIWGEGSVYILTDSTHSPTYSQVLGLGDIADFTNTTADTTTFSCDVGTRSTIYVLVRAIKIGIVTDADTLYFDDVEITIQDPNKVYTSNVADPVHVRRSAGDTVRSDLFNVYGKANIDSLSSDLSQVVVSDSLKVTESLTVSGLINADTLTSPVGPVVLTDSVNVTKLLSVTGNTTIGGDLSISGRAYVDTISNPLTSLVVDDSLVLRRDLIPSSDGVPRIGYWNFRFDSLHVMDAKVWNDLTVTGSGTFGNVLPASDGVGNVGMSSYRFNSGYFSDSLSAVNAYLSGDLAVNGGDVTSTEDSVRLFSSGVDQTLWGDQSDSVFVSFFFGRIAIESGIGGGIPFPVRRYTTSTTGGAIVGSFYAHSMGSASQGFGPELRMNMVDVSSSTDRALASFGAYRFVNDSSGYASIDIWDNATRRSGLFVLPDGNGGIKVSLGTGTGTYDAQVYAGDTLIVNNLLIADALGNVYAPGGTVSTTASTGNLFNASISTLNLATSATTMNLGRNTTDTTSVMNFFGRLLVQAGSTSSASDFRVLSPSGVGTPTSFLITPRFNETEIDNGDGGTLIYRAIDNTAARNLAYVTWTKQGGVQTGRMTLGVYDEGSQVAKIIADTVGVTFGTTSGTGSVPIYTGQIFPSGLTTEGALGVSAVNDAVRWTGQTASIAAQNFANTSTGKLYRAHIYTNTTTAGSGGTVLVTLSWNDGAAKTYATATADLTSTANAGMVQDVVTFYVSSGTPTFATTVAGAAGSPQYALNIVLERLW